WNMNDPAPAGTSNVDVVPTIQLPPRASATQGLGSGLLSGHIHSTETGGVLANVIVNLKDGGGALVATAVTDGAGKYVFAGVPYSKAYFIVPPGDSRWNVTPTNIAIGNFTPPNSSNGSNSSYDFSIGGVPAVVKITANAVGSVVLLSQTAPTTAMPPMTTPANASKYFTTVSDGNKAAVLTVPAGTYFITCWEPGSDGASYKTGPAGLHAFNPNITYSDIACPRP